jgi:hypothetical protein
MQCAPWLAIMLLPAWGAIRLLLISAH